ncbi:MAG: response regulator [Anaerolineales bacterium]|nr:response regulator [Anaerolineales bacterium]
MNMEALKIVGIDDEWPIRRFLQTALAAHQHIIYEAASGAEGVAAVIQQRPDVVILDLGLPDMEGFEVTRRLRECTEIPIIILSVREREADKIAALDAGADDYLTKPFGVGELLARIRAAMRRVSPTNLEPILESDGLLVDMAHRLVKVNGEEVSLTPTEYDLLRTLVTHAGKVLTHHQLLQQVWGSGYGDEAHLLRVNISNLRRKIEPQPARPRYILTEPGVGYRLFVDL